MVEEVGSVGDLIYKVRLVESFWDYVFENEGRRGFYDEISQMYEEYLVLRDKFLMRDSFHFVDVYPELISRQTLNEFPVSIDWFKEDSVIPSIVFIKGDLDEKIRSLSNKRAKLRERGLEFLDVLYSGEDRVLLFAQELWYLENELDSGRLSIFEYEIRAKRTENRILFCRELISGERNL